MRCNGSNWAVYSPGSWDGFRNDVWALWAGVIMRLEHHLVGGYVPYISPHIIIIILLLMVSGCWSIFTVGIGILHIQIQHGGWIARYFICSIFVLYAAFFNNIDGIYSMISLYLPSPVRLPLGIMKYFHYRLDIKFCRVLLFMLRKDQGRS